MSFERCAEYHNLINTVSINAARHFQHRSGDNVSGGAEMLDYYARSLSPEEELIEQEEREEKSIAIKRALRVTRRYIRTVFDAVEVEFIRLILTTDDTPAVIAKSLNADYYKLSKVLYSKFNATSKYLIAQFYACGYYCKSSLDFLPRLAAYIANNENNRRWLAENAERRKAQKREHYMATRKLKTPEEIQARRDAKREAKLAALSPEERERQRKKWEYNDKCYAKKREKKLLQAVDE